MIEKSIANYITSKKWKDACAAKGLGLPDIPEASTQSDIQQLANCLTKQDIVDLLHKKELVIRPLLASDQLGNVGIDFRLGQDFLVSIQGREPFINASKNYWLSGGAIRDIFQFFQPTRRQIGETFILHPHQTVLAVSLEYIKVPDDCILLLFMRSSYSRLGITISTLAQHGYTGCLSLELTNNNNNPVNLAIRARIIQGLFQRVSSSTAYFDSPRKYVCQVRPEPSAVIKDQDLSVLNHLWEASNNRVPSSITP
ncbi:MAG: dCTP deaminase [Chitinophagaceae bacterium]|nr:dCTP deaminase [Chitinophagaceae bacterium]